jgi:hypothetical protein
MKRLLLVTFLVLSLTSAMAAVVTTKFVLNNTSWTDLGAGPMLLGFSGGGVYAVGDTTPTIPKSEGFSIPSGESFYISSTSHVWGMSRDVFNVNAYVSAY